MMQKNIQDIGGLDSLPVFEVRRRNDDTKRVQETSVSGITSKRGLIRVC